ncbi:MAG TPA: hypothetical protein DCP84_16595 [Pseudomonas sp.]|nr:hypothetical protein [Pseudomonas sp.]
MRTAETPAKAPAAAPPAPAPPAAPAAPAPKARARSAARPFRALAPPMTISAADTSSIFLARVPKKASRPESTSSLLLR